MQIWNNNPMKPSMHAGSASESEVVTKQKTKLAQKLSIVKQTILDVLAETRSGVSLAQLPLLVKNKLPFPLDLNEFGFVKLKELLVSMSDRVKLELRGHNQPFARLIQSASSRGKLSAIHSADFSSPQSKGHIPRRSEHVPEYRPPMPLGTPRLRNSKPFVDFNQQLELIRNCIYSLLQEFPPGIESTKLPLLLYMRLGITFDWVVFGCTTLWEFLQKYVCSYYELELIAINPYDNDQFILRLKDAFRAYVANAQYYSQYTPSYSPVHYRFETDPKASSHRLPAPSPAQTQAHSVHVSQQWNPRSSSPFKHNKLSESGSVVHNSQSFTEAVATGSKLP